MESMEKLCDTMKTEATERRRQAETAARVEKKTAAVEDVEAAR
jgi:hypothetical protein